MFKFPFKDICKLFIPYILVIGGIILILIPTFPLEDLWLIAKTFLYILALPSAAFLLLVVYDLAVRFWDREKNEED